MNSIFIKMSQHLVSFINRSQSSNVHEMIENIGGFDSNNALWKVPQGAAIAALEAGKYEFYVMINGRAFDLMIAASRDGYKYLKTTADKEEPTSLLSLPECP